MFFDERYDAVSEFIACLEFEYTLNDDDMRWINKNREWVEDLLAVAVLRSGLMAKVARLGTRWQDVLDIIGREG